MPEAFVEMLRGESNTLGRVVEVVAAIEKDPKRKDELFELYFQPDEWVRLRTSNVFKRLWREDTSVVQPYLERWVNEVALIVQPSVQWTFAQLYLECRDQLSDTQATKARKHIKRNLITSQDWIVLNASMKALKFARQDDDTLAPWLKQHLPKITKHTSKSVRRTATELLEKL